MSSISVTHFVADTYPYSPGTTSRTGYPCSGGNGSPFIAIAIIASRPSMITDVGDPQLQPSIERLTTCVAPGCTPASSSTSLKRTPWNSALPTRSPPTSFDTHDSVT